MKTSWRPLQGMSWRCLQHVFSVAIFGLPRRLQDVFKMSYKTKNCYTEDVSKTSSRYVFRTSWRQVFKTSSGRLGDKKWGYLYLTNLKGYVSNKSIFHRSLIIMYKIINKNPVISIFVLLWNSSSFSILRIKTSYDCLVLWNKLNSNSTMQNRRGNKSEILGNILDKYI